MAPAPDDGTEALAGLESLHALLVEERAALAARDHVAILDCAERKARRADELASLTAGLVDPSTMPADVRTRFTTLARDCDRLNRANGVTVAALRNVVDRALGILRGAGPEDEAVVYGQSGARMGGSIGRYAGSA